MSDRRRRQPSKQSRGAAGGACPPPVRGACFNLWGRGPQGPGTAAHNITNSPQIGLTDHHILSPRQLFIMGIRMDDAWRSLPMYYRNGLGLVRTRRPVRLIMPSERSFPANSTSPNPTSTSRDPTAIYNYSSTSKKLLITFFDELFPLTVSGALANRWYIRNWWVSYGYRGIVCSSPRVLWDTPG